MSADVRSGLLISFINVGDGDAVLIRETNEGESFTMLADAGREDVRRSPDSLRDSCRAFLRNQGIKRIDALLITHLHEDHAGGLGAIMRDVSIDTVYSGYFPAAAGRCAEQPQSVKTVCGLICCLNRWARDVETLKARGARLTGVYKTVKLALTRRLSAEIIVRDEASAREQREIYDEMFRQRELSQERLIAASKLRNANSLRMRLYFAGRAVELAADCYGSLWENEAKKCDLFKVPHHGDRKAVTAALANALRSQDAVISCASEYMPEKDRPSRETAAILRRAGSRVWYVDSFADGIEAAVRRSSLNFWISEDGRVEPNV